MYVIYTENKTLYAKPLPTTSPWAGDIVTLSPDVNDGRVYTGSVTGPAIIYEELNTDAPAASDAVVATVDAVAAGSSAALLTGPPMNNLVSTVASVVSNNEMQLTVASSANVPAEAVLVFKTRAPAMSRVVNLTVVNATTVSVQTNKLLPTGTAVGDEVDITVTDPN